MNESLIHNTQCLRSKTIQSEVSMTLVHVIKTFHCKIHSMISRNRKGETSEQNVGLNGKVNTQIAV